jgi:hypothetical protein
LLSRTLSAGLLAFCLASNGNAFGGDFTVSYAFDADKLNDSGTIRDCRCGELCWIKSKGLDLSILFSVGRRRPIRHRKGSFDMCDCNRDFIDRAQSITRNLHGEPLTPDRMADNFALYGLQRRAAALERFDNELHGDIDSGAHNLRRRVQWMELRRKMGAVHDALRKAKR